MSYQATVFDVIIASPSDVQETRDIARDVIHEWNAINSKSQNIILQPVGWETHASPAMGNRPQEILNFQLLKDSDLLVAIFWTRLGSPTGKAPSGTVEEINKHLQSGKPAMIYFCSGPIPQNFDAEQYRALQSFKEECRKNGYCETFDDSADFRSKFVKHLGMKLNSLSYFKIHKAALFTTDSITSFTSATRRLSPSAIELLLEAAKNAGEIMCVHGYGGLNISVNQRQFIDARNPRSRAQWESALDELVMANFVKPGEMFYRLTREGYAEADKLSVK